MCLILNYKSKQNNQSVKLVYYKCYLATFKVIICKYECQLLKQILEQGDQNIKL